MIPDELNKAITEMLEAAKPRDYRSKLVAMGIPHSLIREVAERHGITETHASQVIYKAVRKHFLT